MRITNRPESIFNYLPEHIPGINKVIDYTPVTGGDINDSYKLKTDRGEFFIKCNSEEKYPDMFDKERGGLEALRENSDFRIPEFIATGSISGISFLVLEYILESDRGGNFWGNFANNLVKLHNTTSETYGWDKDNYIGSLIQSNKPCTKWSEFFIVQRLEPQLKSAFDKSLVSAEGMRLFSRFFSRLESLLPQCKPALLHGDLWRGNYLIDDKGEAVLIDPAVYYGHREMDLAMMKLFGGFSNELFSVYEELLLLEPGWEDRVNIHNLYPVLVHSNLFGGSYMQQALMVVKHYV